MKAERHIFRLALAALAFGLCGCAGNDDLSTLVSDPSKYAFYNCDQLAVEGKSLTESVAELRRLMDKASRGPGGAVANEVAYRGEYLSAVGDLRLVERAATEKKCAMPWRAPAPPAPPPAR